MLTIHKVSYAGLAVLLTASTISILAHKDRTSAGAAIAQTERQSKLSKDEEEARRHFPIADFNEEEPSETKKRQAFKDKQKRHDGLGLVARNPSDNMSGAVFIPEGQFDFPALPVAQSAVIVIGQVLDGEAHLSEDKTNVFSEFTVRVSNVFKSDVSLSGTDIVVERLGGYVGYPNGRKLLYRVGTGKMPRVGGRYLLFLKASPQLDLSILTAYELGPNGVIPLDPSAQFEDFRGKDEAAILAALEKAIITNQH